MIAKKVIVRGRVQGVGFRYFTKQLADKLGVTGVVWNASDGSVRIEAQADETVMTDFVNGVKVSPSPYGALIQWSQKSFQLMSRVMYLKPFN
ncbi:acylphosphatase [Weissella cibaria]|nr:acylphosphatase [Weissella cibaria]